MDIRSDKGTDSVKTCKVQIRCVPEKTTELEVNVNGGVCVSDGISVCLSDRALANMCAEKSGCAESEVITAHISIDLRAENREWDVRALAHEHAVQIMLPLEKPEAMTAIHMISPWWTRPEFVKSFADIPDLTQVLFLKYKDHVECFVPMVGDKWKTVANGGSDDELCLEMISNTGGITAIDEPLYITAKAPTSQEAAHKAFKRIAEYKGIRMRSERRMPEQFDYLGWCSWDAFYTDVDEEGLRAKADEFSEKNVPVKWAIIDDGWMSVDGRMITDFAPDKTKFPGGLLPVINYMRETCGIRSVGVWHALGGYWDGVKPGSVLAKQEKRVLRETTGGTLVLDHKRGAGFYLDWYRRLKEDGVDFVKVDGQGAASMYYADTVPISEAARGMMQAVETSSYVFDSAVINCMGMPMENILGRTASAVSRNSDDFFPKREDSFKEHLIQNAYNALYHDELYISDWDMFWTSHPAGRKHSLLRALSGGPVYFSDRVGETIPEVLKPLCCLDGKVLRTKRSARPTEDCVYTDPFKEGVLKLQTEIGIAAYNVSGSKQAYSISPSDIQTDPDSSADIEMTAGAASQTDTPVPAAAKEYWVYDFFKGKCQSLRYDERYESELDADGYAWYVIAPKDDAPVCLGLTDKFAGIKAVEDRIVAEGSCTFIVRETGKVSWISETDCIRVLLDGMDVTDDVEREDDLYILNAQEGPEKMVLSIIS